MAAPLKRSREWMDLVGRTQWKINQPHPWRENEQAWREHIYIARCSQTRTTSHPCWSFRDARPGKGLVRRPYVDHRGLPCFFNSFIRHHKPRVCRNYPSKERGSSLWEEPLLCCRQRKKRSVPCCYLTITSTRRFMARPASVLLLAIGLLSPWPAADKLLLTPPSRNARAAL